MTDAEWALMIETLEKLRVQIYETRADSLYRSNLHEICWLELSLALNSALFHARELQRKGIH